MASGEALGRGEVALETWSSANWHFAPALQEAWILGDRYSSRRSVENDTARCSELLTDRSEATRG